MLASGPFHAPIYQSGTGLHESGNNFTLEMADWNSDGHSDMIAVKRFGTGTNSTEVFVYSGADSFGLGQNPPFILSTGTALPETNSDWEFKIAKWDGTHPDLMAIHKQNTASGYVELHVLRGETTFQSIHQSIVTPLPTSTHDWAFDFADLQGDGWLDMFGILKNSNDGQTQLHVVNGHHPSGAPFTQFLLQVTTALHSTDNSYDFAVVDIDASRGYPDLVAIKKSNTSTGRTEVHVIDGRAPVGTYPYGWFSYHITTGLHITDATFEFDVDNFSSPFVGPDGLLDLVAFSKAQTGTNTTEVHVFTGQATPIPNQAAVPLPAGGTSQVNYSIPANGSLIINTEYGPVAVNIGQFAGDAGSSMKISGDGTLVNVGNISIPVLELLAGSGLTVNAGQIDVPQGITVAGSLNIGGSAAVSSATPLTVQAGGKLSGVGSIQGATTIGTPAVGSLAILAPGNSPGALTIDNLTLNSGSMFIAEIAGEHHDQVIANQLIMNNPRLRVEFLSAPIAGKEYVLFRQGGNQFFAGQFLTEAGVPIQEGDIWSTDFGGTGLTARVSYQGGDGNDFSIQVDGPMKIWIDADHVDPFTRIEVDGNYINFTGTGGIYIPGSAYARRLAASVTGIEVHRGTPDFGINNSNFRYPDIRGTIEVDSSVYALTFPDGISISSDYDRWSLLSLAPGNVTSVTHDLVAQGEQLAQVSTSNGIVDVRYTDVFRMEDRLEASDKTLLSRAGDSADWSASSQGTTLLEVTVQSPNTEFQEVALVPSHSSLLIDLGDQFDQLELSETVADVDLEIRSSGSAIVHTSGAINLRSLLIDVTLTHLGQGSIVTSGAQIYDGDSTDVTGNLSIDASEWIVNSNFQLHADYLTWDDPLTINGTLEVYDGTFRPATDIGGSGLLIISGLGGGSIFTGEMQVDSTINIANLRLHEGNLHGPGTVRVHDSFEWWGGGVYETATIELAELGIGSFGWGNLRLFGTLRNFGSISFSGNGGIFNSEIGTDNSGVIENKSSGQFQLNSEQLVFYGHIQFVNEGTLVKTGNQATLFSGYGTSELINTGLVQLLEGSLSILKGTSGGTIEIAEGSTFIVEQDILELLDGAQVVGAGFLQINNRFFYHSNTGLKIEGNVAVYRLRLAGPRLGTGTLTVHERLEWLEGGSIQEGETVLAPDVLGEIEGAYNVQLNGLLVNNGHLTIATHTGAGLGLRLGSEGRLENAIGGTVLLIGKMGDGGYFLNEGTFIKSGETHSDLYGLYLQNDGVMRVEQGDIFIGGGQSSGAIEVAAGAKMELHHEPHLVGSFQLLDGATVTGAGDFHVTGGILEIATGTAQVQRLLVTRRWWSIPNSLTLTTQGKLVITDSFELSDGHLVGSGTLELAGTAIGHIIGNSSMSSSRLRNLGILHLNGGISGSNADLAFIDNEVGAEFIVHAGSSHVWLAGVGPYYQLVNRGTLRHIGNGNSSLDQTLITNSGLIEVLEGQLQIASDGSLLNQDSIISVSPSGTLTIIGSVLGNITNQSNLSIDGTLHVSPGWWASPNYTGQVDLEALSEDRGATLSGFDNNFVYERLSVSTGLDESVRLVDLADNSPGSGSEAVYTNSLIVYPNARLDLNGLNLYTRSAEIHGWIENGSVTVVNDAQVVASYVYHKGSTFSAGGTNIAAALDTDKQLAKEGDAPTQLGFQNLISSTRGINGLVFDIDDLLGDLTAADFEFQMSPQGAFNEEANPPASWQAAPAPSNITVQSGSPSRVVIEWPDQSIMNRWLRVTIKANANTGLGQPEVYYLGHLKGETTGTSTSVFSVSYAQDLSPIRLALGTNVGPGSSVDIDKNGLIQFADIVAMRTNAAQQLTRITIPLSGNGGGGGEGFSVQAGSSANLLEEGSEAWYSLSSPIASLGVSGDDLRQSAAYAAEVDSAIVDPYALPQRRRGRR